MSKSLVFILACCLLPASCFSLRSEIIDRIAISAGNQVITEGQIDEELRLTAFLNRDQMDLTPSGKKKAADRLIEQTLVKRDMDLSHYPLPALTDADEALKSLKARYSGEGQYQQALQQYGIGEDGLKHRLWWQMTLLRFIDYRFRPGIQIPDKDMQAYYQQQLANWQQQGTKPIPSFEDTRDSIEQILTEQRIDQALDRWLADTRTQLAIRYHDETLQ